LYTHHKKRVIVLLDEYDAPITNALMKGYYQEIIEFMRGFLGLPAAMAAPFRFEF
jgi:hypothetical protein